GMLSNEMFFVQRDVLCPLGALHLTVSGLAPAASKEAKPIAKNSDVHPEVKKTTAKAKQCPAEGTKINCFCLRNAVPVRLAQLPRVMRSC
ncbi:MAG: hypothetical protein ACXVC7_11395, partial [Bacteroidia bacterium]